MMLKMYDLVLPTFRSPNLMIGRLQPALKNTNVDGVMGTERPQEFPHNQWALLGIIPANENVFDAVIQMDSNQAVSLNGLSSRR